MNFAIVAPQMDDLPDVDTELASIAQWHTITCSLVGYVTSADVEHEAAKLNRSDPVDVLLFSTHGDVGGVRLSNNDYMDASDIASVIRLSGAKLCILNVCRADNLAYRLFYLTQCDIIYCRADVMDKDAATYMSRLSRALAETDIIAEAYKRAGDARGQYKLLNVGEAMTLNKQDGNQIYELKLEIGLLKQRVDNLEKKIADMDRKIDDISSAVSELVGRGAVVRSISPALSQRLGVGILVALMVFSTLIFYTIYMLNGIQR